MVTIAALFGGMLGFMAALVGATVFGFGAGESLALWSGIGLVSALLALAFPFAAELEADPHQLA